VPQVALGGLFDANGDVLRRRSRQVLKPGKHGAWVAASCPIVEGAVTGRARGCWCRGPAFVQCADDACAACTVP
jgi:hypothetical protein